MAVTRYREGNVTVTLTGDLEGFVRRALDKAAGETVRIMEREAEEVANAARSEWYRKVDKETGQSGSIEVITTVDADRSTVRVSVGSTDDRTDKKGRPSVVFVRSPRANSLVKKQVTHEEYWATSERLRANYHPVKGDKGTGPFIWEPNPLAGDGKYLLQELIRKPMKARIKRIATELVRSISARIKQG